MLPPPPPGLGGEQESRAGGGSVPRQVRLETSHWSRSIQILCFDWLASWFYYAIKIQFKASKAPYVSVAFLASCCVYMALEWLPCRERIYYRGWCQQYSDPTHSRLFPCLPSYHSVFLSISDSTLIRLLTLTSEELRRGQANSNLLTEEEEINILFSILYLGSRLPPHLQEHKETMRKMRRGRRSWRRSWVRRSVWPVKQSLQSANIRGEIFGKENISFTEIIFLLIGRLLD